MAEVSVTINGRHYRMACDDGQEDTLLRLAGELDQRVANLRATFGQIGDMRLIIMAAMMLAEELADTKLSLGRAEQELAGVQQARAADSAAAQADLAAAFHSAAERIEQAAKLLGRSSDEQHLLLG
jgi:cell division protein ZapA